MRRQRSSRSTQLKSHWLIVALLPELSNGGSDDTQFSVLEGGEHHLTLSMLTSTGWKLSYNSHNHQSKCKSDGIFRTRNVHYFSGTFVTHLSSFLLYANSFLSVAHLISLSDVFILSYIKLSKKSTKLGFLIAPLPPLLLSSHPLKKTSQTTETFIEGYKRNRAYLKNHFLFSHDFWLRKSLRAERAREHLVHVCLKQFTDQELRWNLEPPTIQREKERREVGQLTLCPQISM